MFLFYKADECQVKNGWHSVCFVHYVKEGGGMGSELSLGTAVPLHGGGFSFLIASYYQVNAAFISNNEMC